MKTVIALTAVALLLGACEYLGIGRNYAGQGAAYALVAECSLSAEQRKANLDAVNAAAEAQGSAARATSLDCDGDGVPDPL